MSDTIVTLGSSLIQHGTFNNRIYLLKLAQADFPEIITELDRLAQSKGYSKIFAKIPADVKDAFLAQGYTKEAVIPHFYNGRQTAYFLGKYFSSERKTAKDNTEVKKVLALAKSKSGIKPEISVLPEKFTYRECRAYDIREITEL
jgi:putative beta-lysine N-acetyltransferase